MPSRKDDAIPLRRIARKYALQYIFQLDAGETELDDDSLAHFWEQAEEMHDQLGEREWRRTRPRVEELIRGIWEHRQTIDEAISRHARNWSIDRLALVDRNILRLSIYELYYCPQVDPAIAINEAIDLAKGFASEKSSRFINGILDAVKNAPPPSSPS